MEDSKSSTYLGRHEFLLRRLHSLSGLIPVGAFMIVHLLTNASVLEGAASFQRNVYRIHGLGGLLPLVEWVFIFIPLLFHGILGVVIIRGGLPNSGTYTYGNNIRYTLQRVSGMIAFVFIAWHVFHMHGWFHFDAWVAQAQKLMGAQFKAYSASSTAGEAIQVSVIVQILYAVGILASVFHLANGIWTMGITWGLWISPPAQRRASWIALAFGIGLGFVGLGGLWGMRNVDVEAARRIEDQMYNARVAAGDISPDDHKRWVENGSDGHGTAPEKSAYRTPPVSSPTQKK